MELDRIGGTQGIKRITKNPEYLCGAMCTGTVTCSLFEVSKKRNFAVISLLADKKFSLISAGAAMEEKYLQMYGDVHRNITKKLALTIDKC